MYNCKMRHEKYHLFYLLYDSFCNNKLDSKQKNGWECGHIISDYNDGKVILSNLRPICAECNRDMGRQNWIDYDPDYRNSN